MTAMTRQQSDYLDRLATASGYVDGWEAMGVTLRRTRMDLYRRGVTKTEASRVIGALKRP